MVRLLEDAGEKSGSARFVFRAIVIVAAAAAIVIWVRRRSQLRARRSDDDARFGFYVKRDGAVLVGENGDEVHSGDAIQFTYTSRFPVCIAILGVDSHQLVKTYFPEDERAVKVEAGQRRPILKSNVVDDALGEEKIYAFFCQSPVPIEPIRQQLARHPETTPLAKNCDIDALYIVKVR